MKTILHITCLVALTTVSLDAAEPSSAVNKAEGRPNIVIILADDMGYSDLGCYGGEIHTPNIDSIAKNGIRFTDYHAEAKCNPSRQALLTGKYHTRAYNGRDATIAECLKAGRYATYMTGKWDMVGDIGGDSREIPQKRGFDHFFGTPMGCGSFFAPIKLTRDGKPAETESDRPDFYYTDAINDNAVEHIKNTPKDKPVFVYVSHTAPHWPLHALQEDIKKYEDKYSMGWDKLREQRFDRMKAMGLIDRDLPLPPSEMKVAWEKEKNKDWQQRRMEVYAAQIDRMDQGVGRILTALRETGRMHNTLIIVSSDNGGCTVEYSTTRTGAFLNSMTRDGRALTPGNRPDVMPGPEDTWQSYGQWGHVSNTPLRRAKGEEYEGGNRVPLIIQWPAFIKKGGQINNVLCHAIDILPTILDCTGIGYPQNFMGRNPLPPDGISLLPVLEVGVVERKDCLFWEFSGKRAVRQGKWKLVYPRNGPWELYEMDKDPTEQNNLAVKFSEKVEILKRQWEQWYSILPENRRNSKQAQIKNR